MRTRHLLLDDEYLIPPYFFLSQSSEGEQGLGLDFVPTDGSPPLSSDDLKKIRELAAPRIFAEPPFASAPVRSRPHRTYDPSRPTPDPEGDYVPMYLADMPSLETKAAWSDLKKGLEDFGQAAGLFDEISIRRFGRVEANRFKCR